MSAAAALAACAFRRRLGFSQRCRREPHPAHQFVAANQLDGRWRLEAHHRQRDGQDRYLPRISSDRQSGQQPDALPIAVAVNSHVTEDVIRLGVNYKFDPCGRAVLAGEA
jgi:hypothetical protein